MLVNLLGGEVALRCLHNSRCFYFLFFFLIANSFYGQRSTLHLSDAVDSSGWPKHNYNQIHVLEEHYKLEKEKGEYQEALKHLENAYQELDKIHDSILRTSPTSRESEWAAREGKVGHGEFENWPKWLVFFGWGILLAWLCMLIYYQIQLGELCANLRYYIQKEPVQKPIAQDPSTQNIPLSDVDEEAPEQWINIVENYAVANLHDPTFSLETWSAGFDLSPRQFQRRVKAATTLTVTEFLQEIKMQLAKKHLESGNFKHLKDLALAVGMRDVKYFSREYKKRFQKSPSLQVKSNN
ncbi:MAG: helix-turn-helix transcriptional regulator [Saprospiraceae bacterium]|nr:helix-turn-helix transcriptional regulator [Saprospiraceae bacterium]